MKLGIVGLPNVGKSTLFNAITCAGAQAARPACQRGRTSKVSFFLSNWLVFDNPESDHLFLTTPVKAMPTGCCVD